MARPNVLGNADINADIFDLCGTVNAWQSSFKVLDDVVEIFH